MRASFLRQINNFCAIMGDSDATHQNYCKYDFMKLQFLSGAGTVTGSRYLLSDEKHRLLVCESTYGDRLHAESDPESELAKIITKTAGRGGIVLLPSFAVGRAQMLLYLIHKIMGEGRIPKMPVYLNSPMAIKATEIFSRHHKEHKLNAAQWEMIDEHTEFVRTVDESIELNAVRYPCGEIVASVVMRKRVRDWFGWDVEVAELFDEVEL